MSLHNRADFYALCDPMHREFFSSLAWAWREAGHLDQLHERGVRLAIRSTLAAEGQGLCLFELLPGQGTAPSTVDLSLDAWRQWFGEAETVAFVDRVKAIHGLQHKLRDSHFSVVNPGHLSGAMQQRLRELMLRMAARSHDLIAQ